MGNNTCQRVLSNDSESLYSKWKQIYDEVLGAKLFLNEDVTGLVNEITSSHLNKTIKNKVIPASKEQDGYGRSLLEKKLQKMKSLVQADVLKKHSRIDSSDLIKHNPFNTEYQKINEYRLEICYLIHTWSAYLGRKMRVEEHKEDFLKLILEKYDLKESQDFRNKLMIITFKMFTHDFVSAVERGDEKEYNELFPKLKIIVESMKDDQKELGSDKEASTIKENFEKICFALIRILREKEITEKVFLQQVTDILLKLVFYLGSLRLHMLLLSLMNEKKEMFSRIKLTPPKKLSDEYIASLPIFWIDREKSPVSLEMEKPSSGSLKIEDYDRPNSNTPVVIGNEHSYIFNNMVDNLLMYEKEPIFETLKWVKGSADKNKQKIYFWNGDVYGVHVDDNYTGVINLNNLTVTFDGTKLDIPYGIDHNIDPILKEVKDRGLDWSSFDFFFMRYKDKKHAIIPRILRNNNYDSSKEGDINYMMVITYCNKQPGRTYFQNQKQRVVSLGGKVFTNWKHVKEFEPNGEYQPGYLGDYFYLHNKKQMVVINIETAKVVSVISLHDTSTEQNEVSSKISIKVHGFDYLNDNILVYDSQRIKIYETEQILRFNLAAWLRSTIDGINTKDIEREELRKAMGILASDDEGSDDGSDISEDGDAANADNLFKSQQAEGIDVSDNKSQFTKENQVIFLNYVDFLTRMIYLQKFKPGDYFTTQKSLMKTLLFDIDRTENKQETYEVFYYMLHTMKSPRNSDEASLLMFVLKSLEHHLEILATLQKNTETGIILKQNFLKKLLKKIGKVKIDDKNFSFAYKHAQKSLNKISEYLVSLLSKVKKYEVAQKVTSLIQNERPHSFEEFLTHLKMIKLSFLNKILKKPIDDNTEIFTKIFEKIIPETEKLMEAESQFLSQLTNKKISYDKFKGFKLYTLQKNLVNCINAIIGIGFSESVLEHLTPLIHSFITTTSKMIDQAEENFKNGFSGKELNEESTKNFQTTIKGFDSFFVKSFIGNFYTMFVTFKEFLGEKMSISKDTKIKISELNIRLISFINVLGKWLKSDQKTSTTVKDFSLDSSDKYCREYVPMDPSNIYDICLSSSGEGGMNQHESIMIFRLSGRKVLNLSNTHSKAQHLFTWTKENFGHILKDVRGGNFIVTRNNYISEKDSSPTIAVQFHDNSEDWRSPLAFVNIAKISLANLSESVAVSSGGDKVEETDQGMKQLNEKQISKLDSILGSSLFANGVDCEVFAMMSPDLDISGMTDLQIAQFYRTNIFEVLGFGEDIVEKFKKFSDYLQNKIKFKNPYSRLGGEIGDSCATALFLVTLKHQGSLEFLKKDLEDESTFDSYIDTWLKCTEIRTVARNYHTSRELKNLFRKIQLLISMESNHSLMQFPGMSETGLGSLSSLTIDTNEQKVMQGEMVVEEESENAADWAKVRKYLSTLREKKAKFEGAGKDKENVVSLVLGLIKLHVEVESILNLLSNRMKLFLSTSKSFNFFIKLISNSRESILAPEIFTSFEKIFRSSPFRLGEITVNYNGVPEIMIKKQVSVIKKIILSFVDYLCSEENPISIKLMAVKSLKWMYKGRESECVTSIDIKRIWESNIALEGNSELMESILELIEVLMKFCVRKIQQQHVGVEKDIGLSLTLKRQMSTVDESSMTNILNTNLSILINQMEKEIENIDKMESVEKEKYLEYRRRRGLTSCYKNMSSIVVSCYEGDRGFSMDSRVKGDFTLDSKEVILKRELIKKTTSKLIKKDEEGNEVEEVKTELVRVNKDEKNPHLIFNDFDDLIESMKKMKGDTFKRIHLILTILYNAIYKIPNTAVCIFENEKNSKPIFKLALESYPTHLKTTSINILSELGKKIPFMIFKNYKENLQYLKSSLISTFQNNLLADYNNCLMNLVLSLFNTELQQDDMAKLLKEIIQENGFDIVLRIFESSSRNSLFPGVIVTRKNDMRNLPCILLPKYSVFYQETLSNYGFVLRLFSQNKDDMNNFDNKKNIYKTWPVYCLLSGTVEVSEEENLSLAPVQFNKQAFVDLFRTTGMVDQILKSDDLTHRLRAIKIINEFEIKELFEDAEKLTEGCGESEKEFNITVTDGLVNSFLKRKTAVKHEIGLKKISSPEVSERLSSLRSRIQGNIVKRATPVKKEIRTNVMLRRSTACLEQIDTQIYLNYEDLGFGKSSQKSIEDAAIKKCILREYRQIEVMKKSNDINLIVDTCKQMATAKEGYEKTTLETKLNILLDGVGNEENMIAFIKGLTTVNGSLDFDDMVNEYFRYKLAYDSSRRVKNIKFLQDFSLQTLDTILLILNRITTVEGALDNPYLPQILIILCKNFREFVHILKKLNHKLDLTEYKEQLEIVFRLGFIDDEWAFKIWQQKDCDELESLYPHLIKTLYYHTELSKEHFKNQKEFSALFDRLDMHQYGYEIMQGDDERASDIYISGKIACEVNDNKETIAPIVTVYKLKYGMIKPLEIEIKGYNYWGWKICSDDLHNHKNVAGVIYGDQKRTQVISSQFYYDNDWKGIHKSAKYLETSRMEIGQKVYLDFKNSTNFYLATDDRYDRRIFDISSNFGDFAGDPSKPSNYCIARSENSDRFAIYNGRVYFFNDNTYRNIFVYEGITHGSNRFLYNKYSRELLIFDNYFDMKKPNYSYRIDNCYYSHNYMFISRDMSLFPEIRSMSSDTSGECCILVFVDGTIGIVFRNYDNNPRCNFYKYLKKTYEGSGILSIDNSDLGKNCILRHYNLEDEVIYVDCPSDDFTVVTVRDKKGRVQVIVYERDRHYRIKLPEGVNFKSTAGLQHDSGLGELFIVTEEGRLFQFFGIKKDDSRALKDPYFEELGLQIDVEVSKSDRKGYENASFRLVEVKMKDHSDVIFEDVCSFRDSRTIIVKYQDKDTDDKEIFRTIGFTRETSDYYTRVIQDLRFLRLTRNSELPENGLNFYCFMINNIRSDFNSRIYRSDGDDIFKDYRVVLRSEVKNAWDLEYPFILYYDHNQRELVAKNIPKSYLEDGEFDLSTLIEFGEKKGEPVEDKEKLKDEECNEEEEEEVDPAQYDKPAPGDLNVNAKQPVTEEIKEKEPVAEAEDGNVKAGESILALIITSPSKIERKAENIKEMLINYSESNNEFVELTKEQPEQCILRVKKCPELTQDDFKFEQFLVPTKDYVNQNPDSSFGVYFKGKIKKGFNLELLNRIGGLEDFESQQLEIKMIPDIYRMNKKQWENFKKESEEVWRSKKTKKEFNDDDEEIEIEVDEYEEGLKNFRKYRDIFVGRMKISKYPRDTCQISAVFYKPTNRMEEITDGFRFTDDIVRERAFEYVQGLVWINHKIWLHYINSPFIGGNFWETDTMEKFKVNAFDTFSASLQRTIEQDTIKLYVNRIMGEKSTYEDQDDCLMNQMFYYFFKWANNQKGAFYQVMRYNFEFLGEPGIDAGGLRREYMFLLAKQVLGVLKLFVRSPNSVHNLGRERDKYIPNPSAVDVRSMDNYFKLGFIMAAVYVSGEIININLPSIFWKFLLNHELVWEDVKSINHSIYVCLEKIEKMPESDIEYLDETFVTPDGMDIELKPNGRNILLTSENRNEYINLVKEKIFAQFMPAFKKMKEGFYTFVNFSNIRFNSIEKIEQKLCGMNYVDIEVLKRITKYKNFNVDHPAAKRFWRVLETFNQDQLAKYLKYVWGRTRLSHGCSDNHELVFFGGRNNIPEAHTCFFQLDLGDYETDEELSKKLLYGIENCNEIAEDDGNYNVGAEFGA